MTSRERLLKKIKKKLETEEKLGKRLLLLVLLAIVRSLKTQTLGIYYCEDDYPDIGGYGKLYECDNCKEDCVNKKCSNDDDPDYCAYCCDYWCDSNYSKENCY